MMGYKIHYNIPDYRTIISEVMSYPEAIMQVQNDFEAGYIVMERMTLHNGSVVPKTIASTAGMIVSFAPVLI